MIYRNTWSTVAAFCGLILAIASPAFAADLKSPPQVKTALHIFASVYGDMERKFAAKNYDRLPHENEEFQEAAAAMRDAVVGEPSAFKSHVEQFLKKALGDSTNVAVVSKTHDDVQVRAALQALAESMQELNAIFPKDLRAAPPLVLEGTLRSPSAATPMSRRSFLLNVAHVALLAPVPTGAALTAPDAIAFGGFNLVIAELMRRQRFLESFGLAPNLLGVAGGTKILGGGVSGYVDASLMSGFGQVFPAIERGAAIRIIGGGALLPVLALYSGRPPVVTLKDLEGRSIGTGSVGALVQRLTVTLLRKYQVDLSRIRFVNIGSNADIFRAVSAGTVDAGVGEAALIDTAGQYGVHLIEHGHLLVELKDYTYQGAWESKIATEPDTLVRALAAYGKLYRFVQRPDSRAPDSDHETAWHCIQTCRPFAVELALSPERLRYMQELNVGFQVQREVLPFSRVAVKLLGGPAQLDT